MNDEKITISMDDVNQATPIPGSAPSSTPSPTFTPPYSAEFQKRNRSGLFIGIGIAVGLLLCGTVIGLAILKSSGRGEGEHDPPPVRHVRTVEDTRAEIRQEMEKELASPSSSWRTRIEDAHVTVHVTSAEVVWIDLETKDGSNLAGDDDENIKALTMLLRFHWQGMIDSGYTDLKIVHDAINKRTETAIDYTTAMVNTEDTDFWTDLGFLIGTALAL